MYAFHRITLEDREQLKKIYAEDGWEGCEYTFGNNILWGNKYYIEVAYIRDCCLIRYDLNYDSATGRRDGAPNWMYSYPMGKGGKKAIVDWVIQDSHENHYTLFFNSVTEKAREDLMNWYPNRFSIQENRNYEDYIYLRERLATLAGKKLHKKRTHINHFKELGEWSFEWIHAGNTEDCLQLCKEWGEENADRWDDDMDEELHIVENALLLREDLHLMGGLLRVEGKAAAFCIGEDHGDNMVVVHFEKALTRYPGSYQMINQQFALHLDESITYVNREDDTGNPGLRKAKLSYYPDILLKKYNAIYSDVIFADPIRNREDIVHIWKTVFGDSEAFIGEFLDRMAEDDTVLLYCEDGKPVSMACFLPVTICEKTEDEMITESCKQAKDETITESCKQAEAESDIEVAAIPVDGNMPYRLEDIDARYVYAVATLPEHRGKGYAGKILAFAEEKFDLPLILSPAEESLYEYYGKLGFRTLFRENTLKIEDISGFTQNAEGTDLPSQKTEGTTLPLQNATNSTLLSSSEGESTLPSQSVRINNLTSSEYKKLRDARFSHPGFFKWNESTLNFIYYYYGGESFHSVSITMSDSSEDTHILMYNVSEDTLQIRETSLTMEQLKSVLPLLDGCASVTRAVQILPGLMLKNTKENERLLKSGQGYFNFSLGD